MSSWAFIQQGGGSFEFYVSVFDSEAEAHAARVDCAREGAYLTTPAIEVPELDADTWDVVDALMSLIGELGFP